MTVRGTCPRSRGWLVKSLASDGVKLHVCAKNGREGGKERAREKESYIQNSRDKAEAFGFGSHCGEGVRSVARLYVEETGSRKVGYRL